MDKMINVMNFYFGDAAPPLNDIACDKYNSERITDRIGFGDIEAQRMFVIEDDGVRTGEMLAMSDAVLGNFFKVESKSGRISVFIAECDLTEGQKEVAGLVVETLGECMRVTLESKGAVCNMAVVGTAPWFLTTAAEAPMRDIIRAEERKSLAEKVKRTAAESSAMEAKALSDAESRMAAARYALEDEREASLKWLRKNRRGEGVEIGIGPNPQSAASAVEPAAVVEKRVLDKEVGFICLS